MLHGLVTGMPVSSARTAMDGEIVDRDHIGRILAAVGAARGRRLTVEEAFIFLAIGHLGLSQSRAGFAVKAVPCAEVAALLRIPKETVRRKAMSLAVLGLVSKSSQGVAVEKIEEWLDLAQAMSTRPKLS